MRKKMLAAVAVALAAAAVLAVDPGQYAYPLSGAPIATVSVSTVSASTPTINGNSCYRVGCAGAQVYWRVGVLPLTAVATDNPMNASGVELVCLRSGYNGIAFITASGTATCAVNTYAPTP
jgi:hypothetical protein